MLWVKFNLVLIHTWKMETWQTWNIFVRYIFWVFNAIYIDLVRIQCRNLSGNSTNISIIIIFAFHLLWNSIIDGDTMSVIYGRNQESFVIKSSLNKFLSLMLNNIISYASTIEFQNVHRVVNVFFPLSTSILMDRWKKMDVRISLFIDVWPLNIAFHWF